MVIDGYLCHYKDEYERALKEQREFKDIHNKTLADLDQLKEDKNFVEQKLDQSI